ncbi:hypothetical protein BJ170DRAFT_583994 [Xylariales sp. AK1849]|nr:hypothetical protein BJ170DRAFT_583994 [Xylariales sp. AK1849]
MSQAVRNRRAALAAVAKETKAALPDILRQLPHLQASGSETLSLEELPALDPSACPGFKLPSDGETRGTFVRVLNADTFDAALQMAGGVSEQEPSNESTTTTTTTTTTERNRRVAVLNLASDKQPGGGWLNGSQAQEEALCYRSSLSLSLHSSYYPWAPLTGIYTRDVVIVRSSQGEGHRLLTPRTPATELPVVSVISVAGIRRPALSDDKAAFKKPADRSLTKMKMKLVLRTAAIEKHEMLVLGAIGCGAFANPPVDVARCWLEVLEEDEFKGGWWRELWFAVFDARDEGNYAIFEEALGGKEIGKVDDEASQG